MAATYTPIASTILTTDTKSVTFSSIPATYTDLLIRFSAKTTTSFTSQVEYALNTVNTSLRRISLEQYGNTASANARTDDNSAIFFPGPSFLADTFNSAEIYFSNYNSSANKNFYSFSVFSTNGTTGFVGICANLRTNTAALTEIKLTDENYNFKAGSSFHLYGILNS